MKSRDKTILPLTLPPNPSLADLLETVARAVALGLNVSAPGRVLTYNPTTQKADVQLDFLAVFYDPDVPNGESVQEPVLITGVPVAWPGTGSGYLTFPLGPGDTGLLVFADRSLEQWKRLGVAVDPEAAWAHALQDAVFQPGLHPDTAPISPPTSLTATVLDGDTQIKVGAAATQSATMAEALIAAIDAMLAAGTPVGMDGGASLKATMTAAWNAAKNSIKATKAKVE